MEKTNRTKQQIYLRMQKRFCRSVEMSSVEMSWLFKLDISRDQSNPKHDIYFFHFSFPPPSVWIVFCPPLLFKCVFCVVCLALSLH